MELEKEKEDVTGRSRFARNVIFSWGGYSVYIIAGFIMPRLISQRLGQVSLGVWDFAWTTVGYFGLVELGLGASVDRYVARYRAAGDTVSLNRSVASIFLWMMVAGILVLILACVVSLWGVPAFGHRLGSHVAETRLIVFFLGLAIAVEIALGAFWGVIIGVHRWDLHNSISAGCQAISAIGMAIALTVGGGLVSLAIIHSTMTIIGHLIRVRVAYRVCPELRLDLREAKWSVILEQGRFSAKNLGPRIAELLANQTTSMFLAFFLGPAALAVFSRPRVLIKHVRTMIAKFSFILVPSASSVHVHEGLGALREMFSRRVHQAGCVSVPAVLWLALLGGPLVEVWMGKAYFYRWLVPVLALGYLGTMSQDPVWAIMTGINQHGKIGLVKLAGSVVAALGVWGALGLLKTGLVGAAVSLTLPMFVVDAVVVPILACGALGMPLRNFYKQAMLMPLLYSLPSVLCLVAARFAFPDNLLLLFVVGAGSGGLALCGVYYVFVLPERLRRTAINRLNRLRLATCR